MASSNKKILVVDDEPDVRDYISTFLEDHDYNVTIAADGKQGLQKVREDPPDLVTLDVTMPEKSGVRFYREMRESEDWKNIPIIIITGVSGDFEHFISSRHKIPPPDAFFSKPIDRDKLIETIEMIIGR